MVLSDWTVMCYTSDLTLLWNRKLIDVGESSDHYFVKSMGILVAPYSLQKGDLGCVIVGGSFGHRDHDARYLFITSFVRKFINYCFSQCLMSC